MKKYLMSGVAAIAFLAAFTSCSKSTDLYEEGRKEKDQAIQQEQKKNLSYAEAFEKEFGKIDPNQNWGFKDQGTKSSTRSHNVNENEWGTGNGNGGHIAIPKNVTQEEHDLVLAEFSKKREGAINTVNVNWTDFYVAQVHKGEDSYYAWNQYEWTYAKGTEPVRGELKSDAQKNVKGSDKMNHLQCFANATFSDLNTNQDNNGTLNIGSGYMEFINNFNGGNNTNSAYNPIIEGNHINGITFMENSGTMDFAYHNSCDSKYHNEYIIIAGADIDPSLAGYYYVGFDFCADGFYVQDDSGAPQHLDQCVDRDWVFNDWIVRISPGDFVGQQRIFVEDLITSDNLEDVDPSDWDFNDAVFDAFIKDGVAIITLRAAGGTLNLTVGGKEVHQAFGVSQETMVNTGKGPDIAPVMFRINCSSTNAVDIPVIVTTKKGTPITLTAEAGKPTQKLAANQEDHVKWLLERHHISDTGYPSFAKFVGDKNITWWNPANQEDLYQKWY